MHSDLIETRLWAQKRFIKNLSNVSVKNGLWEEIKQHSLISGFNENQQFSAVTLPWEETKVRSGSSLELNDRLQPDISQVSFVFQKLTFLPGFKHSSKGNDQSPIRRLYPLGFQVVVTFSVFYVAFGNRKLKRGLCRRLQDRFKDGLWVPVELKAGSRIHWERLVHVWR